MLIFLSALYLALLGALLYIAYHKKLFHLYYARMKGAVSLGFLLLSFAAAMRSGQLTMFLLMVPGLLLCFAGDILLGLANTKKQAFNKMFLGGVAAFAVAHLAFIAAFSLISPTMFFWHWWMLLPPCALVCGTLICSRSGAFRLERMKRPAVFYSACVGSMLSAALALGVVCGWNTQGTLFAAGALLFVASDCILLFLYFYCKPRKALRALNLLTYYLGMLCFAWALAVPATTVFPSLF